MLTAELLLRLAETAPGPERVRLERQVIRLHATLARDIARRYVPLGVHRGRGTRAAMAALVRAVRTWSPSGPDGFESYVTSMIQLELSRLMSAEDAHAAGPDEQTEDDQDGPEQDAATDDRDDAVDDEYSRDEEKDERHADLLGPGC